MILAILPSHDSKTTKLIFNILLFLFLFYFCYFYFLLVILGYVRY